MKVGMRILHLAFEDPARPGSGGGSIRTREINRRLAGRHEITAVVAGYPGAAPRLENGIRWVPIGTRTGTKRDMLAYFALLGTAVRRHPHDLVVEDFGAPFSVGFSPFYTRKPVVAMVQWLFAAEKRAEYGLPFDWVENAGLPFYKDFIATSPWLADVLRRRRPGSVIEAIPNGVDAEAFAVDPSPPRHLLYVGRLEIGQKGCDLLLDSVALARVTLGDTMPPLVVVGDGPDRAALEQRARNLGLADVVEFRGRVDGPAKYRLMASSYAVLMPSRYETFGMVAVESLAATAPLIAFDVGPLGEVAGPGGARLVPPFNLDAFAQEIISIVRDRRGLDLSRLQGRAWATRYNWDRIAALQEDHYRHALARAPGVASRRAPGSLCIPYRTKKSR
jgi:glycosyltransferase involved in cell wall biosynthesis